MNEKKDARKQQVNKREKTRFTAKYLILMNHSLIQVYLRGSTFTTCHWVLVKTKMSET